MQIITTPQEMQTILAHHKREGQLVAAVPTMGALHEGHLQLVDRARELAPVVAMSIFVNPIQFNEATDFQHYPRTLEADSALAQARGCDYLFVPDVASMYPKGFDTTVTCGAITTTLEGAARPGHFTGVTTVVMKLFMAMQPDYAVFGQKDAQQLLVIMQMVRDLNMPIQIVAHPTIREEDGLALSSRNRLLTDLERQSAPSIQKALLLAAYSYDSGEKEGRVLCAMVRSEIEKVEQFSVEYVSMSNHACQEIEITPAEGALVSVAVRCIESDVRLIDNAPLGSFWS